MYMKTEMEFDRETARFWAAHVRAWETDENTLDMLPRTRRQPHKGRTRSPAPSVFTYRTEHGAETAVRPSPTGTRRGYESC